MVIHSYAMDEPLLTHSQSMQPMNQMNQTNVNLLPPEFLMPVPFCELVCNQVFWAFCECGVCLCCII